MCATAPNDHLVKLLVGLGNPGPAYEQTRHNAGFLLLDLLVARWDATLLKPGRNYLLWEATVEDQLVYLMKPLTYMNLSGEAVKEFSQAFSLAAENMLIAYDDTALQTGQLRLRPQGSSGGQKGLQNIIDVLGHTKIPRLRIGVGPEPKNMSRADFVLSQFTENEWPIFENACQRAGEASFDWLKDTMQTVMNRYNAKVQPKNTHDVEKTTPGEGGE